MMPDPEPADPGPSLDEAQLAAPDLGRAGRLFDSALEQSARDPAVAAIDYSRAAANGHGRAAYYLAQMYETGDGVPFAPDTAWAWYAVAAAEVAGAEERLAELAAFPSPEAGFAVPVFSSAESGVAELVWEGRGSFIVELGRVPSEPADAVHATPLTAARLQMPEGAAWWRVRAIGSEPSAWRPIDPAGGEKQARLR
jgi:TPR repeat protein